MARNFLFIVIDQMRADCVAGALADAVDLPNIRALAEDGVLFSHHYTVATPCGPSRASLLTGMYAMNHRSVRNGTPLAAHHQTLGTAARAAGYEPLLFGYTDVSADPAGRHPADPDLHSYEGVAPGFAEIVRLRQESPSSWHAYLVGRGYDLGPQFENHYRPVPSNGSNRPQITDPAPYAAVDSDTAFLTDRTIEELSVRRQAGWFALVTYIRPHPPLVAPAPYNTMYSPEKAPLPVGRVPVAEQARQHPFFAAYHAAPTATNLFHGFDGNVAGLSEADLRALRAVYFGLATEVDVHVGRLFDWLQSSGQWDDTTIVLTADHGELLGDHNLWGKSAPFEPALRIPLIVRSPDHRAGAGKVVDAFTETTDLAPTILEMMGAPIPRAMDGAPLTGWLDGQAPGNWRQHVFAEVELGDPAEETPFQRHFGLDHERCNFAVLRDARFKYVHFNGGVPPMLFDLREDPFETRDLAADPAHAADLARMRAAMLDHRMTNAHRALSGLSLTPAGLRP